MDKQIKIRIYPNGEIVSNTVNIKGSTCTKYAKALEQITQAKVIDSELTSEYYETEAQVIDYEIEKVRI